MKDAIVVVWVATDVLQSRRFPSLQILPLSSVLPTESYLPVLTLNQHISFAFHLHRLSFASPGFPCSFRIKVNSGPPLQRKLPSSLMQPLPRVEAPSKTAMRKITRIPTCSSHCTSTSTEWRRVAKGEVSLTIFPSRVLMVNLGN